jgi:hypothetical protein
VRGRRGKKQHAFPKNKQKSKLKPPKREKNAYENLQKMFGPSWSLVVAPGHSWSGSLPAG